MPRCREMRVRTRMHTHAHAYARPHTRGRRPGRGAAKNSQSRILPARTQPPLGPGTTPTGHSSGRRIRAEKWPTPDSPGGGVAWGDRDLTGVRGGGFTGGGSVRCRCRQSAWRRAGRALGPGPGRPSPPPACRPARIPGSPGHRPATLPAARTATSPLLSYTSKPQAAPEGDESPSRLRSSRGDAEGGHGRPGPGS